MGILHIIDTILTVVEDHQEVRFLCFYDDIIVILTDM
jgi:hypothetical protein